MKFVRLFFLSHLLGTLALISACSKGELVEESQIFPFQISSKTVLDYNLVNVTVRFTGNIIEGSISEDERLQFFSDNSCSGATVGSSLVSEFKTTGVNLSLPINLESDIYISSATSSECIYVDKYRNPNLEPSAPVFERTEPASPSREVTDPGLFGTAFPPSGTIEFFSDDFCTVSVSTGPVSAFSGAGLIVPLPINTITNIHAVTKDALGQQSDCTELVTYEHNNSFSSAPRMTYISEASPSNKSFTPTLRGSTDLAAVSVGLFRDSGCTIELASGTPDAFLNVGFQITSSPNSSITIYGRSLDAQNMPSTCARLTTFVHDDIDPAVPAFVSINPASPTNATTVPAVRGTASADTETVTLFSSNTCLTAMGSGTKAQFEGAGVTGGVSVNSTTNIYARAYDKAGNDSSCVLMTTFVHNNIPPSAPLFVNSDPPSPTNGTLTPLIRGNAADRTVSLSFFKDAQCSAGMLIGSGNRSQYEGSGISVNVDANTETSIYVAVSDIEGNISECTYHAPYDHSNTPAPDPGFFRAFPSSPTRASNNPAIIGTAVSLIKTVEIYDDATCTNSLGGGTRGQFISSGINIALPANSTTDIHARSTDIYGNLSSCAFLTNFVHNTVEPTAPTYSSVAPLSPNNSSFTPVISGTALVNPASQLPPLEVSFYDSPACVSKVGEGTPDEFSGAGITLNLAQNSESFVYARVFDEAGNRTACTFMTNYTHNARQPGVPIYGATNPASPSYTRETSISGSFGTSLDFMNRVSVIIYSDSLCTSEVTNGSPTDFEGAGIDITADENSSNSWYAVSVNEVGTRSNCVPLTNFVHHDAPISTLSANLNSNGSVFLNWNPDTSASPLPRYSVERSLNSGGPFSVITSGQISNSFTDLAVADGDQYFYRVFGTNNTGRGQNSPEVSVVIASPPSVQPVSLNATGRSSQVTLTWSGFPQNMTYKVLRSNNYGGPFVEVESETTSVSYFDSEVTNDLNYYYVVIASNPSGLSMRSNIASATPRDVSDSPTELTAVPSNSLPGCGGGRGLRLSWTGSSYFTQYRIGQTQNKNDSDNSATTSNNFYDYCNPPGETRYYSVSSMWGSNRSVDQSNPQGYFGRNAPNFSVFPGNGEVVLDWDSLFVPTSPVDLSAFAMQYDLYRSTDLNGEYQLYQPGLLSSDYIDSVPNGMTYYYYVQPFLIDGDGDRIFMSYPTQKISGTPGPNPVSPTNLTLVEVPSENRVQLNWVAPRNYNGFLLYTATSPGGPFVQSQYTTNTSLGSVPLVSGMNYFKISSAWGSFETADSNIVSFRNAPINAFTATGNASDITLNWGAVSGVQDYVISRANELEGTYSNIGTSLSNSYVDSTALAGVGYYYKVRARFADFTQGQLSIFKAAMRSGTDAPQNVSLRQLGPSGVQVVWPRVAGATNYIVRSSDSFAGTYVSRGSTTNNTFTILGNAPDVEVFVTVTAVKGPGNNFTSDPVSIFTYDTPSAPIGNVGDNQVELTWSAVTSVVSYDILRTVDGATYSTLSSSYPTTSFTDTTALNGNVYMYKIRLNFPGGEFRETTLSAPYSPGQTPLDPNGLNAENNNTGTGVVLTWGRVSGTTRYNIYRSTSSGSYGAPVQTSNNPDGTTVSGLTSGTTYYFRVSARNGSQESGLSNEVAIVPTLTPPAPTAEYSNATSVDVFWSPVAGASTYNLERSTDGLIFNTILSGLMTSFQNDSTVDPNKKYYYRYRGFSASGAELAVSNVSQGVNISVEPQTPVGFEAYAANTSAVTLEWVDAPSVFGYEILRSTTSGGPYTTIASPNAVAESYVDSTVTPGQTYFYVIRSLSASKTPSAPSVEKAVDLNSGPASLNALNNGDSVDLSWSSVPGALTYEVRRSRVSGGPYALIASTATLDYSDTSLTANLDYFYVVQAVFANAARSPFSNEAVVNRDGFIDLQVVIELTDTAIQSLSSSTNTFERTQTSFDTDYYDGMVSYDLEIVANNFDSVSRSVSLVDGAGVSIGSIVVPTGLTGPTRIKVAVTPHPGADVYRLSLEQTTSDFDLVVRSAKLLVNQAGATKTRLYFPLLSSDVPASTEDASVSVFETSSESYASNVSVIPFERRVASLERIVDYNAWELEAVVSTSGIAEGSFVLKNMNTSLNVEMTETRFTSMTPRLASVPIDEGAENFSQGSEGDFYRFDLRCEYNCDSGLVKVHKAGLWVELENLSKARVVNRIHSNAGLQSTTTTLDQDRILFDAARYSTTRTYFQTYVEDDGISNGNIELVTNGNDSGDLSLSPIVGSNLYVDNDGLAVMTSSEIAVSSGQRVMTRVTPIAGEITSRGSVLIIDVER